jgi:hypothetical protein
MTMYQSKKYARLRAELHVDPMAIGEELVRFPMVLLEACETAAEALRARDRAAFDHKTAIAVAAAELRQELGANGKPRSESSITSEAPLAEAALEAHGIWEEASASASYWVALVEAMRAKQSSLKRLADLTLSGYLTTNAVVKDRREEQAELRVERARLRRTE